MIKLWRNRHRKWYAMLIKLQEQRTKNNGSLLKSWLSVLWWSHSGEADKNMRKCEADHIHSAALAPWGTVLMLSLISKLVSLVHILNSYRSCCYMSMADLSPICAWLPQLDPALPAGLWLLLGFSLVLKVKTCKPNCNSVEFLQWANSINMSLCKKRRVMKQRGSIVLIMLQAEWKTETREKH